MTAPKGWKARKKRNDANPVKQAAKAARIAREKHDAPRQAALSQPITAEQHVNYKKHLLAIPHGMGECWIHVSKSTTGRTKTYTRVKYNGYWVPAHRFALAVKLGCTPWDLEGFNAGHAPAWVCMGGRCCNPSHLRKEVTPQGAWSRSADRFENGAKPTRTPEQQERMVKTDAPARGRRSAYRRHAIGKDSDVRNWYGCVSESGSRADAHCVGIGIGVPFAKPIA